jgi:hypothetical protein
MKLRLNPATGKLQVTDGGCGSGTYTDYVLTDYGVITDTNETSIYSHTFTNDTNKILKVTGIAKTYGLWRVYHTTVDPSNLVTMQNTNSFKNDCEIVFWASETYDTNDVLIVTFQAYRYETSLLGVTSETFVRIEAYR